MSYKTDKLVELFPDAYAAKDTESLLYKLLDAIGAELMGADDAIKRLLKSHWVDYASGAGLDGLGAIYGVERRRLRNGLLESDDAFRLRLKSVVPLFTGGGTVKAIAGAVRSALGLPFDLEQLKLPPGFEALRQDIEKLIVIEEFSPSTERVISDRITEVNGASELILQVNLPTVTEIRPQIQWTFTQGGGRRLTLELLGSGEGIKSIDALLIPPGKTLTLSAEETTGRLTALIDLQDVSQDFTSLDGGLAILPRVPQQASEWKFRAQSGLLDISTFDSGDSYDLPEFRVELRRVLYQPLTFDVYVPYFLERVATELAARHGYKGKLFVFEGLPLERIQEVVNQTKAAGVQGNVHFSLNFLDNHEQSETLKISGIHQTSEDAAAKESLNVGSVDNRTESHTMTERFVIGGVFDVSIFDGSHVFF